MVNIVENHAEIEGELLESSQQTDLPGFVALTIRIASASAVGNWPNLFTRDIGQTISVRARADTPAALSPIGPIRLKVKKVGPSLSFAEE